MLLIGFGGQRCRHEQIGMMAFDKDDDLVPAERPNDCLAHRAVRRRWISLPLQPISAWSSYSRVCQV